MIGRVLGGALLGVGLWGVLSGDPRLAGSIALGPVALPGRLITLAGVALGGLVAFAPRPLLPMLLIDGTLLAAGLVRFAGANWTHVIWGSSPPLMPPPPPVMLSALLVPTGILLAHAEAWREAALKNQRARGVPPTAPRGGLAAAGLAALAAMVLVVASRLPAPLDLGLDLGGVALAVAVAAAVFATSGGRLKRGEAGSTSPPAPPSDRVP